MNQTNRTNLTRNPWIKQVAKLFSGRLDFCKHISEWIINRLAENMEVEIPGLGVFYTLEMKVKLPKGPPNSPLDISPSPSDGKWDMREVEVCTLRFRPFTSAKKMLRHKRDSLSKSGEGSLTS